MNAVFGPFEVLSRLGVGGMGEVFLARSSSSGNNVALKLIRPELVTDPKQRRMFHNEARIGALLRHPNLVRLIDEGEIDGVPYLAMEYVRGASLGQLLAEGPLSPAGTVEVMRQLCDGLEFVHTLTGDGGERLGVVHRDVSCSNVLVSTTGEVKLTDFGIGRTEGQTMTSTSELKGKRGYLPPEVLRLGPGAYGPRSDLFAAGVVLVRLATGEPPFDDVLEWQARGCPLALDGELGALAARVLAPDPERRPASAAELRRALDAISARSDEAVEELRQRVARIDTRPGPAVPRIDGLVLDEIRSSASPPPVAPRRSRAWAFGAVGLLAVSGIGWGVVRWQRRAPAAPAPIASAPPAPPAPVAAAPVAPDPPAAEPVSARARVAVRTGLLTLDTEPWGTAYLGSRKLGVTPFVRVRLPAGKHQLMLDVRDEGVRRPVEVTVTPDSEVRMSVHLPATSTATRR
jgi:serine/threonine-protein kinase